MRFIQIMLLVVAAVVTSTAQQSQKSTSSRRGSGAQTALSYGSAPLFFEANQGQTDPQVKFFSRGRGYSMYLTSGGMVLALKPAETVSSGNVLNLPPLTSQRATRSLMHQLERASRAQKAPTVLRINLVGGAANPEVQGEGQLATRVNYFIGNDPKLWRTNVSTYAKIRYKNVYPGIDLIYYGNQGKVEYDFDLAPGADPKRIQFAVTGSDRLAVDDSGNLVLSKGAATVRFETPVLYQTINGIRARVPGTYVLRDGTHVGFVVGNYDTTKPLVIDPVLVYSTYLGGGGDDFSDAIAVDASGNTYLVGITDSPDFPTALIGTYTSTQFRMFLTELDSTGSNLIFADYFGGFGGGDESSSIALDPLGNIYVAGTTTSTDFPTTGTPFQSALSGSQDAFLAKFSSGGSLVYSTYLGGSTSESANSIAVDPAGEAIIAGSTTSADFPTSGGAYQTTVSTDQFADSGVYGFVTKFASDLSGLVYSTYLSGSHLNIPSCTGCFPDSEIMGVATDSSGNAYVVGNTTTDDFPTTAGAFATVFPGYSISNVGFVSKFSNSGGLAYSTFLGAQTSSFLNAIAVDSTGSAYVTGFDISEDGFPIVTNTICDTTPSPNNCNGAVIAKLDSTGAHLVYSTYLAATNEMAGQAIQVDASGDAFIVGSDTQFSTTNSLQPYAGNGDVVVAEIDPTGTSQLMATFLGGQGFEASAGSLALDNTGKVYVTGVTQSSDFPVTQSALQRTRGGQSDVFVSKIDPVTSAPAVVFAPVLLQFSSQALNTPSVTQTTVLRNMGSAALNIASNTMTGDFSETDDCGTVLAAASFCTFTITFTPTILGPRSGSLAISDDAAGSPHSVSLSGTGTAASSSFSLTPSSLSFSSAPVGSPSGGQTITVTNTGGTGIVINGVQVTGDFAVSNNQCGSLPANATCRLQVTFMPSSSGVRTGTLRLTDAQTGDSQTIPLDGSGIDFVTSAVDASATVTAGSSASYRLAVGSVGGSFAKQVSFSCSGVPAGASCMVNPVSVTPGGNSRNVTVTVKTSGAATQSRADRSPTGSFPAWCVFTSFGVFGVLLLGGRNHRKVVHGALLAFVSLSLLTFTGCAGGTGSKQVQSAASKTPTGTYTLTVTGTSGMAHHSTKLTLTVLQ